MEWTITGTDIRKIQKLLIALILPALLVACKKSDSDNAPPAAFRFVGMNVDGVSSGFQYNGVSTLPAVNITFSDAVDANSVEGAVTFKSAASENIPFVSALEDNNKRLVVKPSDNLSGFAKFTLTVSNQLKSTSGTPLETAVNVTLATAMDSTDKFERISQDELLTLVQRQTFKYFWDFGHPVSGLARERNTSGDIVTSGGSGFGIMAMLAAVHRGFISREEGLARLKKIVSFLKNDAQTFHGAFPHWLNGATGEAVAFSEKDNGADLVETSYLIQGLLSARQFFSNAVPEETTLRNDINSIWHNVEWNWFTRGEDVLYWHWSPDYEFEMNMPIRGWNECLVTYVLAASSPTHAISRSVYDNGWAQQGAMANNASYYGIQLPLGPAYGGPLFFAHYSFLGINPHDLTDAYANYWEQNRAHSLINYQYCIDNPEEHAGYSNAIWGLTASDNHQGYSAHSPQNDLGVISPTAALSSMPYTPEESMRAMEFFYYKLGDKIFKEYGFVDAFNLNVPWFANSFLAIDQGPIIIMIENHRSGLLWSLFMSCDEVKAGMSGLGFSSPNL